MFHVFFTTGLYMGRELRILLISHCASPTDSLQEKCSEFSQVYSIYEDLHLYVKELSNCASPILYRGEARHVSKSQSLYRRKSLEYFQVPRPLASIKEGSSEFFAAPEH